MQGEAVFRTPLGVRCATHDRHAEPDEPCWACERDANDPPRGFLDQSRLHLALLHIETGR